MALQLGDTAPDFTVETTEGTVSFHDWLGDGWGVLFSHPADFTPVCTTELGTVARIKDEFDKRDVKPIAISVDPIDSHHDWIKDINGIVVIGAKVAFAKSAFQRQACLLGKRATVKVQILNVWRQ